MAGLWQHVMTHLMAHMPQQRTSLHEVQGGSVAVIVFALMTDRAHDHLLAHYFEKYDVAGRSKWHDEFP